MSDADLNFYFDPVCPFAWMTSKWVRTVMAQRDYAVDWRFISLRMINADIDYDTHFPPEYEAGHTAGLKLLRVAARARAEHGREAIGALYAALGRHIFDSAAPVRDDVPTRDHRGTRAFVEPILAEAGLASNLAEALDDPSFDPEIRAETDEALGLTGKDVGTPIIHFRPPDGVAFFGPVISRLPNEGDALRLWDHVVGLASFPGFAELKRSLREAPQLRGLGVDVDEVGAQEDWHGGSRSNLRHSESIVIAGTPENLYEMVSDVTRIGEWSPVCRACWWDEGDSAQVGARFTGRNELPDRTWETRSEVVVAQPGREFAFVVGSSFVRWGYTFAPVDGGTQVTESWEFLPDGIAMFEQKYGATAQTEIAARTEAAHNGIPITLAAIKRTAESA